MLLQQIIQHLFIILDQSKKEKYRHQKVIKYKDFLETSIRFVVNQLKISETSIRKKLNDSNKSGCMLVH